MAKGSGTKSRVASTGSVVRSTTTGRFLSRPKDVAEFEEAARAYTKKNTRSKKAALKALREMGMVTRSGRLTKRYA
ncbi:hypothetical protein [Methyloceanibacter sp.]|uniref:hypothetical protein n=1 Tax=Methyloceanibacter sp. TaxID=1965321 RepID=UPI002D6A155F|nr:hypothetical protein [Methyloceanibacter sp.]HZP09134.1 hypothetical protein [Methyloceanibacter sp.]